MCIYVYVCIYIYRVNHTGPPGYPCARTLRLKEHKDSQMPSDPELDERGVSEGLRVNS